MWCMACLTHKVAQSKNHLKQLPVIGLCYVSSSDTTQKATVLSASYISIGNASVNVMALDTVLSDS